MGERAVDELAVEGLARELDESCLNIGRPVEFILRSSAFFAQANLGSRVVGPVEYVIGACQAFVRGDSSPSMLILADWMTRMGQDLFEPPNVGGWPVCRSWLNSRSLVARANFAAALVEDRAVGLPSPINAGSIAAEQGLGGSSTEIREAATALLLGVTPLARKFGGTAETPDPGDDPRITRGPTGLMSSPLPHWQVEPKAEDLDHDVEHAPRPLAQPPLDLARPDRPRIPRPAGAGLGP